MIWVVFSYGETETLRDVMMIRPRSPRKGEGAWVSMSLFSSLERIGLLG